MPIDLYYFPVSPPTRAVILLCKILGVHLNLKEINIPNGEQRSPEYTNINPQHTVPTIDDNGLILGESRAIMGYLVNKYAKNDSLYPKDPKKKGIVDERLYFDNGTLWSSIFDCYIPVAFGLTNIVPEDKVASIEKAFEVLDKHLENEEFVAGNNLTIADISIIISVGMAGIFGFDIARFDNVAKWFERCQEALTKYGYEEVYAPGLLIGEWFQANLEAV